MEQWGEVVGGQHGWVVVGGCPADGRQKKQHFEAHFCTFKADKGIVRDIL